MKLRFKNQKFQADAAAAVCDVFAGQPNISTTYIIDKGITEGILQLSLTDEADFTGYANSKVLLSDSVGLENLQRVQRRNMIEPSKKLEGRYNLQLKWKRCRKDLYIH